MLRAALLNLLLISAAYPASLPAFPGAEGFGTQTPGGRGGREFVVTTLADSGPGSLREAVSASGPRIVTFKVGGVIHLQSPLSIKEPFITIDASTAPPPGITLTDGFVVIMRTHDVVIRYLRSRPGDKGKTRLPDVHGFSLGEAYNIVLDHCSAYWGIDENIGMWNCHDLTVQWCILAEGLFHSKHDKGPHSMGILVGGDKTGNVSLHHNLLASSNQRNPRLQNGVCDVRNNIFFNWGTGGGYVTGNTQVNFIANLYIPGSDTDLHKKAILISPEVQMYIKDTALLEGSKKTLDWDLVLVAKNAQAARPNTPFAVPAVNTLPLDKVYEEVLAQVGAVKPVRDSNDERVVRGVRERKGKIIDTPPGDAGLLRVTGDELAWNIETPDLLVDLGKNPGTGRNGQINTILLKYPGVLFTRGKETSTLHLSPNFAADKSWIGINRWDPPGKWKCTKGSDSFCLDREGPMPQEPGLYVRTKYEIFSSAPVIAVDESIEVKKETRLSLLRLDEISFATAPDNPFTHIAWEDAQGHVFLRAREKEEILPLETRWLAFLNQSKGFGFASVMERLSTGTLRNSSAKFAGEPHYFYRTLVYRGEDSNTPLTLSAGNRYAIRHWLYCFRGPALDAVCNFSKAVRGRS